MFGLILVITAILAAATVTQQYDVVVSNTCLQRCNKRSCDCGVTDSNHAFIKCDQVCTDPRCVAITCSSRVCHQKCHNCHMECTSEVAFCRQRCLSGACSFKCNAKQCQQERSDGSNNLNTSDNCEIVLPRHYLALLAGLLFAISTLSCLLLVLSFRKDDCCHSQAAYSKLRSLSDSVESLNSLSPLK